MLITKITEEEIKNIFGNNENKVDYLNKLFLFTGNTSPIERSTSKIEQQIIDTWSYEQSIKIIRDLFKKSPKYIEQQKCGKKVDEAIEEWKNLNLGALEWPFSAMSFDQHVHLLNRRCDCSEEKKDAILSREVIKFRRIKHINALRNDYIEYLIFQNENVIPTFGNIRGIDFYISGEPYDQKVGRSVGKAFIEKYGENYREVAIMHPEIVAKSLYENQDKQRFGAEPRLFVIYLDSDVNSSKIQSQLSQVDFKRPYEITFNYKHSNNTIRTYKTKCFVVLLHK